MEEKEKEGRYLGAVNQFIIEGVPREDRRRRFRPREASLISDCAHFGILGEPFAIRSGFWGLIACAMHFPESRGIFRVSSVASWLFL